MGLFLADMKEQESHPPETAQEEINYQTVNQDPMFGLSIESIDLGIPSSKGDGILLIFGGYNE